MHALYLILPTLGIFAIAYRYYSAFIATRVMMLDDSRVTPAHTKYDGHNYYPTSKWVLFGHHFAAITGSGPLIGPTLAAQFGYAPGFIWLVAGCCLAGAVHDFVILWASVRRGGRSLAEITRDEIGPVAWFAGAVAILFIVVIAIAGLGIVVVNALAESPWGTFTIAMTIPLAIFMGFYMYVWRKGQVVEATVIGIAGLMACVIFGEPLNHPGSTIGEFFRLTRTQLVVAIGVYGFTASVLPVWLLLSPRDYLSSFMKIGTITLLIFGIVIVNPELKMPALTQYAGGGGPIIPGPLFPFCFITIACGAISGFHSLVASGTTPKMVDKESHIRPIGYGAMLIEGVVGVLALIAATSMHPGDYFAINTTTEVFNTLGMSQVNLPMLEAQVGESVAGRASGAVSLAIGMAQIFTALPGMSGLMAYWYHFAIMFEALFILTTIDAGTRVGRFLLQEFLGRAYAPFSNPAWIPGSVISTALIVLGWGYFIYTGSVTTIWPMFGVANQLLGVVALSVATTVIINMGKARYAWITAAPLSLLTINTFWGAYLNIKDNYYPMATGADDAVHFQGWVLTMSSVIIMVCAVVIIVSAVKRWSVILTGGQQALPAES
ncbi:MAG TPA: carbon starvation protein A [Vicinamibacterales bacterium]|nr:carbon starvation protein A [Vicinamibacterales bacterium]